MRELDKFMENEIQLNKHWVRKENKNEALGRWGSGKQSLQDGRVHKQNQNSACSHIPCLSLAVSWDSMLVILALKRLRQEDIKFQRSPGYIVKPYLKITTINKQKNPHRLKQQPNEH